MSFQSFVLKASMAVAVTLNLSAMASTPVMGLPAPHPVHPPLGLPAPTPVHPPLGLPVPHPVGIIVPRPVGLPVPPRPVGLPIPRPPRPVGLPVPPRPVGIIVPRPVGLPVPVPGVIAPRPPILGMPALERRTLQCFALQGGEQEISSLDLRFSRMVGAPEWGVQGTVNFTDGGTEEVSTRAEGAFTSNRVDLHLVDAGDIHLSGGNIHGVYQPFFKGSIRLFGRTDTHGLQCQPL